MSSVNSTTHAFWPVPVLSLHVFRTDTPTNTGELEMTHTELESYYVLPDEARSGAYAHKLSFQEAIQSFIV